MEDRHFRDILHWISPTDYDVQQADVLARCTEKTGRWFFESPEFAAWVDGSARTLFCPGIPGAGKTFLTAILVHHLRSTLADRGAGVAVLYCSYKTRGADNARSRLAGLVRQLLKPEHAMSQQVRALHEQCRLASRAASFSELSHLLECSTAAYPAAFILIDALDECERAEWPPLLSEIRRLQARLPHVRLMVTLRPQVAFDDVFADAVRLEIRANSQDLELYINGQVPRLSKHVERTPGLRDDVVQGIIKAADGM